jgi:hypothetical protein
LARERAVAAGMAASRWESFSIVMIPPARPFRVCREKMTRITHGQNGALVLTDAMGTQTRIATAIRDRGGDHSIWLKKNWPAAHTDVEKLFNEPPANVGSETTKTVDLTRGRIETRRHRV